MLFFFSCLSALSVATGLALTGATLAAGSALGLAWTRRRAHLVLALAGVLHGVA